MKFPRRYKKFGVAMLAMAAATASGQAQVLSFDQAKQRADAGDAFAQAVVALHYQLGWNTQKNSQLAAQYAIASAEAGHPLGQFRLGALLRVGEGVPKDEQQGLALQSASFNALYNAQDPYSMTSAAIMVFQGKVVGQNVSEDERRRDAAALYKKAADMGYAPAQFNYAMALNDGHGVRKNPELFEQYLDKARVAAYPLALSFEATTSGSVSGAPALIKPPELPLSVADDVLNPETFVWEPAENKGYSSQWYSVLRADQGDGISIDARPQYSEFPAGMGRNHAGDSEKVEDWQKDATYSSMPTQSLYSSWQHVITSSNENLITVGLPLEAEKRNLLSITEYPISLEFRIQNKTSKDEVLKSVRLDVVDCVPLKKIIPILIPEAGRTLVLHNFGWAQMTHASFDLTLCGEIFSSRESNKFGVAKINHNEGDSREWSLDALFALTKRSYDPTSSVSDAGWLMSRTKAQSSEAGSFEMTQALWLNVAPTALAEGYTHTRLKPDLVLPGGRSGYAINYAADLTVPAKGEVKFTINFALDKSSQLTIVPNFEFSNGQKNVAAKLFVEAEVAKPMADVVPTNVVDAEASDVIPYWSNLFSGLGADWNGNNSKSNPHIDTSSLFLEQYRPDERAKANASLLRFFSGRKSVVRLRPSTQTDLTASLFLNSSVPSAADLLLDGWNASFSVSANSTGKDWVLELRSAESNTPAAEIPWSFPERVDKLDIQLTGSSAGRWVSWVASDGDTTRLYLAFPGLSDCAWSLPMLAEENAEAISASPDGSKLLIRKSGGTLEAELSPSIILSAVRAIHAGGATVAYNSDVDELARVRFWVPLSPSDEQLTDSKSLTLTSTDKPSELPPVRLAWLDSVRIGVHEKGKWRIWNLASGTALDASEGEIAECENASATMQARLKEPNYAREDSRWVRDLQVNEGFKLAISSPTAEGRFFNGFGVIKEMKSTNEHENPLIVDDGWEQVDGTTIVIGNYDVSHRSSFTGSETAALSHDERLLVFSDQEGRELYLFDVEKMQLVMRAIQSAASANVITVVSDNYYLSGDGRAEGVVFTDGVQSVPIARFEAKFNRPDIILGRLGADESLIEEAERLRERLVRRSDFKSFDGATLIDIPVVTVKSEVPKATGEKSLSLDFEASNSTGPLKELRVFNNGALVKTLELKGKDGQPSREANGEVEIGLASGENRLQLMAVSEEGFTSSFAEKRVNCTAEPDSRRCLIAAVGVSEYNDPRFNLKFAAKDAEDISKALAEKARHRGYQPEVLVVKNAEVDSGLVDKLREFLSQAGTDDEVVLFLAGHGLLDKDLEYHFARHDTDFDATENMGITFEALESLVDGIKPLKRTVLFDTCHSGEVEEEDKLQLLAMVGSGDLSPTAAADSGVQVRGVATRGMKVTGAEPKLRHADFVELEGLFPDSRRAKGANILTSSSGSEFSMESDAWQNGLFTYAFLNALQDEKTDADGNKEVSFNEAATAVQDKVKTLSGGHQRPITRGVNREAEVTLASFGPPVEPIPTKEKKSGWWPF